MDYEALNNITASVCYYNHRISTPSWEISDSFIDFVDITYVISGQAKYTINNQKYIVSAGDLLCIPMGSRRSATICPDVHMECYSINGYIHDMDGNNIVLPLPLIFNLGIQKDIIALYKDLDTIWRLRDCGYQLKARALYLMILHRYFQLIVYQKDSGNMDKRIKKILQFISNHYAEPLTVQNMAQRVNLSDMYFGNLFKKEIGMSFRKYLTTIRISHAEDMLNSCEYKISEIAEACGFTDVFYFSRIFKENRGYAPSDVIRSKKVKVSHPIQELN